MVSTESIASALESIDLKKAKLRKTYDDLQAHSQFLSSFTLQWKDLEEHFESIQKSIEQRFTELKKLQEKGKANEVDKQESPPKNSDDDDEEVAVVRRELKSFCSKMDGKGLLSFICNIKQQGKELESIRNELVEAMLSASDPAKLVLNVLSAFYPPNYDTSKKKLRSDLGPTRRTCIFVMERLKDINMLVEPAVKKEAYKLAMKWKELSSNGGRNEIEAFGFLQLLATYDLASSFNSDELIKIAVDVAKRKDALDLYRSLGLADRAPDLIRNLCDNGRQLEAVKFACGFNISDKFPPRPLLKAYLKNAKKLSQEIRKSGNHSYQSQREATAGETVAVKAMIKCIEEHNLESEYPLESLEKQLEDLAKQKPAGTRARNAPGKHRQTADDKDSKPKSPHSQAQAPYHPSSLFSQPAYSSSSHLYGSMTGSRHPFPQDQRPLPPVGLSPNQESLYMNPSLAQMYGSSIPGTNFGVLGSGPPSPYGGGFGASTANYGSQQTSARLNPYSYDQQNATSGGLGASTSNYGTQQVSARPTSYSYGQQHAASGSYDDFPLPL